MNQTKLKLHNAERHAAMLLDLLVDVGPITSADACDKLGWSPGRFSTAVRTARDELCPDLGLVIPTVHPPEWLYQVTTEWEPVETGAAYALGHAERRLRSVQRDVEVVLPHLPRGTQSWRRANFLSKHLTHILGTLEDIDRG